MNASMCLLLPVSLVLHSFSGWLLVETCPECHRAMAAAAGHKAFWRHLPIQLAHQHRSIPHAPRSMESHPAWHSAERGSQPWAVGLHKQLCIPRYVALSPTLRHLPTTSTWQHKPPN